MDQSPCNMRRVAKSFHSILVLYVFNICFFQFCFAIGHVPTKGGNVSLVQNRTTGFVNECHHTFVLVVHRAGFISAEMVFYHHHHRCTHHISVVHTTTTVTTTSTTIIISLMVILFNRKQAPTTPGRFIICNCANMQIYFQFSNKNENRKKHIKYDKKYSQQRMVNNQSNCINIKKKYYLANLLNENQLITLSIANIIIST